tara:strand:- start:812 stop:913 length:102 start_codon:yes stop_codon:yes gene_type:complete
MLRGTKRIETIENFEKMLANVVMVGWGVMSCEV